MRIQLLVLFVVVLMASAIARMETSAGGWSPIKDINDPHVIVIANFAVTEYNKHTGANLKLDKLIKGESQVASGIYYDLILSAGDGSHSNIYKALVWEKTWQHNLISFVPANN